MAKIEKLLQMMTQRNVSQVRMISDQPFQIFFNGSRSEGSVTPAAQLLDIMEEIVPPSFIPSLKSGQRFQFVYSSDSGKFDFNVEPNDGTLQVSIQPAKQPAPPLSPLVPQVPISPQHASTFGPVPQTPVPQTPVPVTPMPVQGYTMPNPELYISQNGQSIGPLTPEAAQLGVQNGQYKLYDMAIAPHMKTWDTLQNVLDYYGSKPTASVGGGVGMVASGNKTFAAYSFLNEEQDPGVVAQVINRLKEICTPDETILYIAVQKKPIINLGPASVALTTKRVIIFRPKAMGLALSFDDFPWWNVADTHISEQILGSTFTVTMTNGAGASIELLPKAQARKLYQFSQQKEEHMHLYRRELLLEERRAGASNVSMVNNNEQAPQTHQHPVPQTQPQFNQQLNPAPSTPMIREATDDPIANLQKLKTMFDMNLISQDEYESKKAEIMSRL